MTSARKKYKIIRHHIQTREGAERLAASMAYPIRLRMLYSPFLTPQVYTVGELGDEAVMDTVRFLPEPISWADESIDLLARIERQQERARHSLVESLDASLFERLLAAPVEEWDEQRFRDAADALSDGEARPRLVMSALTFAKFRKAPRWIDEQECQRTTLECGLAATIMGCSVFASRHLQGMGEVFIVSRRPSQTMTPLEVGVRVTAYDAEAKSVTFGYTAQTSTQGTPEVRRFVVGDLG